MDPLVTSALISGGTQILGGLFGGKSKKGPSPEEQIALNRMAQIGEFDTKMELSKKHGIHPLTMLGAPAYSGPSIQMNGAKEKPGVDFNALGQGIDRLANVGRNQTQRKLDELALEQASLSNDYLRVQIAGAQKAITQSGASAPFGNMDSSGNASPLLPIRPNSSVRVVKDEQITKNSSDSGKTAGNHAGFMTLDLGGGYTAEVPKSDEWAESIGEMPVWYKYPKIAEIAGKRTAHKIREKKYSKKWLAPWDPRKYKK